MRYLACLVAVAALLVPSAVSAFPKTLSGGCNANPEEKRGFCSRLVQRGSFEKENIYFELVSYGGGGYYFLCLKPPQRRELCLDRQLRLDRDEGFWIVRVALDRFPHPVDGYYRARWVDPRSGNRLGPRMHLTWLA